MDFIKVQIPYRGVIPIINRRGPIPCIELELSMAKDLNLNYGVEMLDPFNGSVISFVDEVKEAPVEKKAPEMPVNTDVEKAPSVKIASEKDVTEGVPGDTKKEEVKAEDKAEEPAPVEETTAPEIKEEPKVETEVPAAGDFDHTKIEGYSSLSKSKKRELRTQYTILVKTLKDEELYAKLNEIAKA